MDSLEFLFNSVERFSHCSFFMCTFWGVLVYYISVTSTWSALLHEGPLLIVLVQSKSPHRVPSRYSNIVFFWLSQNLSNHMDSQAHTGDTVLAERWLAGAQTLSWWLGGRGRDDRQNTLALLDSKLWPALQHEHACWPLGSSDFDFLKKFNMLHVFWFGLEILRLVYKKTFIEILNVSILFDLLSSRKIRTDPSLKEVEKNFLWNRP